MKPSAIIDAISPLEKKMPRLPCDDSSDLGNIVGLLVVLTCVPLFAAILRIPFSIIGPIILVFCAIGAYSVHNSTFDVVLMLVFGLVGYVLKKCNYPLGSDGPGHCARGQS